MQRGTKDKYHRNIHKGAVGMHPKSQIENTAQDETVHADFSNAYSSCIFKEYYQQHPEMNGFMRMYKDFGTTHKNQFIIQE